jgi:hypothetical protein
MKRTCPVCGARYAVPLLRLDSGFCALHKPSFFSKPAWMHRSPAGTRALWDLLVSVHIVYAIVFATLLDGGEVSTPVAVHSLAIVIYFAVRLTLARSGGCPVLSRLQTVMLLLLPLYGPVAVVALSLLVRLLREGLR